MIARPVSLAEARAQCDRHLATMTGEERTNMLAVRALLDLAMDDTPPPADVFDESLDAAWREALALELRGSDHCETPPTPSDTLSR